MNTSSRMMSFGDEQCIHISRSNHLFEILMARFLSYFVAITINIIKVDIIILINCIYNIAYRTESLT